MIAKCWVNWNDDQIGHWLADPDTDEAEKNDYLAAACVVVQCGWTRQVERSRRLGRDGGCGGKPVETPIVQIMDCGTTRLKSVMDAYNRGTRECKG